MAATTGANVASLEKVMKVVYEPALQNQVSFQTKLLNEFESTSNGVSSGAGGGLEVSVGLTFANNKQAGGRAEDDTLFSPGKKLRGKTTINLTSQTAAGGITGISAYQARGGEASLVDAATDEIQGTVDALTLSLGQQVHGNSHGGLFQITNLSGVASPWTTDVPARVIESGWIEIGSIVNIGTLSSGTITAQTATLQVTAIDYDARTCVLTTVDGSPTVANTNWVVINGTANNNLHGLDQIITDETSVFQSIDPAAQPLWKAVRENQGGAFSFAGYEKLRNKIAARSGQKVPDLVVTTYGIERAAYDELKDQLMHTGDPNGLKKGEGVFMPGRGTPKLMADINCKSGSLFALNTSSFKVYADGDYRFLEQGGSRLMRLERKDNVEFHVMRYMQLACTHRRANGELHGITDSATSPF